MVNCEWVGPVKIGGVMQGCIRAFACSETATWRCNDCYICADHHGEYHERFAEKYKEQGKKERINSILTRLAAIETECASCGGTCIAELATLVNDAREVIK